MAELQFESSLTMEEIEENFKDFDLFTGIMESLQEVLAYKKGEAPTGMLVRKRSIQFGRSDHRD